MTVAELAHPLFLSLDRHCKSHSVDCPYGGCVEHPETLSPRTALHVVASDDVVPLELVRDPRCQQCTMVLTLQSIQRNVPEFRLDDWLDEPLLDLNGRTPRECLNAGDLEPVIDALWLLDQTELTCG